MAGIDIQDDSTSQTSVAKQVATMLTLGLVYIVISAGLIAFNKRLINPQRFPFAVFLVLCHAGFSSCMAWIMYFIKPSLFPSLTDPEKKVPIDSKLILRAAVPIAVLFSGQLVLSNTAYLHSSTAFLQMLKESNLVLVFVFSLIASLEVFTWTKVKILTCVLFATMLTIHGELKFSMTGFMVQGTSQFFESAKIVFQALILSGAGYKLDPLSYVMLVMPLCFAVLTSIICFLTYVMSVELLKVPTATDIANWWPMLLANACVAFALNVTVAVFVKNSSAVAFILAGIAKDAVIVLAGGLFLGELVSPLQVFAFLLQLMLIWVWSSMKMFPQRFEEGVISGVSSFFQREKTQEDKSLKPQSEPQSYQTIDKKTKA